MPSPRPIAPPAGVGFSETTDPQPLQNEGQHESEDTPLCQRKPKHHLTMIPEDLKPISYRFDVVLAGEKAGDFAQTAVETEFALEHMQRKADHHHHHGSPATGGDDEEEFVFFCPPDESEAELARLRLRTCIGWSQHLPLSRDRAVARNLAVVLLFWHVEPAEEATREAISDFRTRVAEIGHADVQCRPYTTLLAFGASDEQRANLESFVKNQKIIRLDSSFYEEDTEDCVVESLKKVCASTIAHMSVTYSSSNAGGRAEVQSTRAASCGCAAM